ncbi:LOW QUALITY PROTEIN: CD2 antigen cytoplasmic tail-binding protein 2 [Chiloscyllium punctatum]|uniref:LOW QUALITY PROTEIN: CD2 antigen cytoplasmic tail-binding protein 2 n=1 Tax=Chiloscyllium punctatum TaxID=137246 RepID=UPI003B638D0F
MSKRKVAFEVAGGDQQDGANQAGRPGSRFKGKHSLDSDEEDDEDEQEAQKYDILATEDIEGQEVATIDYDEGIRITPFNLEEEMEEGHFDSEGNYFLRKEGVIRDNWLDNIDWVRNRGAGPARPARAEPDQGNASESLTDVRSLLEGILDICKPGETVAKALRRLGSAGAQRPKRKKRRRAAAGGGGGGGGTEQQEDREKEEEERGEVQSLDSLTSLADQMVAWGEFEIYQETYERIRYRLRKASERSALPPAHKETLDMFAEQIDESELLVKAESPPGQGI